MSRSILNNATRVGDVNPVAGAIYSADGYKDTTSLQIGGAGAQVDTIQIGSASNGDTITVNVGEDSASLTSCTTTLDAATGASDITAAAAVADTINATLKISNLAHAANNSSDIVTLTGRQKGAFATFVTTASGVGATATVTSPSTTAADATAVQFGLMCEQSTGTRVQGSALIGSAVGTGTYTAQIAKCDIAGAGVITTNDIIHVTISGDFDGLGSRSYSVEETFATSENDTVTALVLALNTALPVRSVVVTDDGSGVLTATAEVAGVGFQISGGFTASGTPGALAFTASGTTANAIPTGGGVALQSHAIEQNEDGITQYTTGDNFSALTEGKVFVRLDAGITIALGDPCFVRTGTASTTTGTKGAFSNVSDSGDNVPISAFGFSGTWLADNSTDMNGANVAPLHIKRA